jgi:hypothetical protein
LFKLINSYLQDNLDKQELYYMKDSTKLILSAQNNWIYQCNDEEIFEKVFQDPYSLMEMSQKGQINFTEGSVDERNTVERVDSETIV